MSRFKIYVLILNYIVITEYDISNLGMLPIK